jgi:uncharacterized membrane protein
MGIDTTGYELVKTLHILAAIIGFGTVFLNGLYGMAMKRKRGPEAAFMAETVYSVSEVATYFIYAVFLLGFALVGMSDSAWEFDQTWVWLSILLYLVALGISHGMLRPNVKRMNQLMGELATMGPPPQGATTGPPPQALELEERGKRQGMISGTLNVMLIVITWLMVAKPGL